MVIFLLLLWCFWVLWLVFWWFWCWVVFVVWCVVFYWFCFVVWGVLKDLEYLFLLLFLFCWKCFWDVVFVVVRCWCLVWWGFVVVIDWSFIWIGYWYGWVLGLSFWWGELVVGSSWWVLVDCSLSCLLGLGVIFVLVRDLVIWECCGCFCFFLKSCLVVCLVDLSVFFYFFWLLFCICL